MNLATNLFPHDLVLALSHKLGPNGRSCCSGFSRADTKPYLRIEALRRTDLVTGPPTVPLPIAAILSVLIGGRDARHLAPRENKLFRPTSCQNNQLGLFPYLFHLYIIPFTPSRYLLMVS